MALLKMGRNKILYLICLLFLACREEKQEKRSLTFAYCILNPRFKHQEVIVDSLYGFESEINDTSGISGAKVFLLEVETGETINFVETEKKGIYRDTMRENWVKPLFTYDLFVAFQRDTLWGRTKVPDTFRITFPNNFDTIPLNDFDSIIWRRSLGRKVYFLAVIPPDTAKPLIPIVTEDTFVSLAPFRNFYFDTTAFYTIKVCAWDENRYRYMVMKNLEPDTLGDGLGHFASQTEDTISVFVRR
jgi:hypothetical protein|uniref:DUF4249 family protein n=1 Tax=candidate division WOR-3 bacterium TaxID=2052148 RepID=A0A7C3YTI7_UNCW3